jgi:subtilisin-like proprotein convertase family protein/subtilisin family serine protease
MRLSAKTWVIFGMILLVLGAGYMRWGNLARERQLALMGSDLSLNSEGGAVHIPSLGGAGPRLLTQLNQTTRYANTAHPEVTNGYWEPLPEDPQHPHRIRNTAVRLNELARLDHAILLNNALIDTSSRRPLGIPEHLQAPARTRSYLVQTDKAFDQVVSPELLENLEATKVSYIPNNTWLVRMDPDVVAELERTRGVRAVVPYAPYFKISESLISTAKEQETLKPGTMLSLTVFPDESDAALEVLQDLQVPVISKSSSPFGDQYVVGTTPDSLVPLAVMDLVQWVEPWYPRAFATDLARVRVGVDTDATNITNDNHHGLTGKGVIINVNDTGIDGTHPDLTGRVISPDNPASLRPPAVPDPNAPLVASIAFSAHTDPNGHGTHVAGIIASSGENSPVVTNIINSATNANFHGMAPESELFSLRVDLISGPLESDEILQTEAATFNYITRGMTNAMISNNSWRYPDSQEYGLAAASYDAAVRDALPLEEGDQSMVYVFAAGNAGNGERDGTGGSSGSIESPATAKNVITVGAVEHLRYITNEVISGYVDQVVTNETGIVETNQIPVMEKVFLPDTDSATEVASFSSRGNVGIGIEGEGGRFKPDVVAPGTFVVSTRSKDWESPGQLFSTNLSTRVGISVNPGDIYPTLLFIPNDGVRVELKIVPNEDVPIELPDLPLYVSQAGFATTNDFAGYNEIALTPDAEEPLTLTPGSIYYFGIGNESETTVAFDLETRVMTEEEPEGYFAGLKELNDGLEPHYRMESGTSMAAPVVSGMLGLMQQHLTENGHSPSPALLKALLINGARSSGTVYDFQIDPLINYQGWGLPNLNNSLPSRFLEETDNKSSSVQFFDQDPDLALATGDVRSWDLNVSTNGARAFPMRVTLVWTDPPGNPAAGIKLVNDLDLVVSNTVSGDVYFGNDFAQSTRFTRLSTTNSTSTATNLVSQADIVNNVENVYINGPLSTNYVVSVIGRRVNVNTVFDHPDGVVQDFALVISSGDDSDLEAPFEIEETETPLASTLPPVISITNGIPRLEDRVGANSPLLGTTNGLVGQWQFYMFTNSLPSTNDVGFTNGPNVAFVTFLPPNLSRPRTSEADIDLFVSRDAGLLDLNPGAIAGASKSLNQGGTEVVLLENQPLGDDVVYYVGVKSEDHQGGQYAFVGLSQEEPFDFTDANGNRVFRGIPLNQGIIPDGTPASPGAGLGIAIGNPLNGLAVQSVVVEETISHQNIGDLLGSITHNGISAVLNNHTLFSPQGSPTFLNEVYDDFGFYPNSIPSDGPGNLINFIGENGVGVWLMTMVDNSFGHTGTLTAFNVVATPNQLLDDSGVVSTVQGESFVYFFVEVPADASALTANLTEFDLPLDLYLRHEELPTQTLYDKRTLGLAGDQIISTTITTRDIPPLNAGRYFIGIYNPNPGPVDFRLTYELERNLVIDAEQPFFAGEKEVPITDFALTDSLVYVPDDRPISEAKVGIRLDHPRLSDLSLHLVSPQGTRLLLMEHRGRNNETGLGSGIGNELVYGGFSDNPEDADTLIKYAQGPFTTNANFLDLSISGFEQADLGNYLEGETIPADADGNEWEIVFGRARVLGGNGSFEGNRYLDIFSSRIAMTIPTPVGQKYDLFYASRSIAGRGSPVGGVYLDGRRAQIVDGSLAWQRNTPLRFRPANDETLLELTFLGGRPSMFVDDISLSYAPAVKYYFPEEPLESLKGESAVGDWHLEVRDTREGAITPQPILYDWQLLLSLANTNVQAETLRNGQCFASTLEPDEVHYFVVEVPRVATMATNWLSGTGDLEMWFDNAGVPTGEMPPDVTPPINYNGDGDGEGMVISLEGMTFFDPATNQLGTLPEPVLQPGQRYYLAVANNHSDTLQEYELCLQFDADDIQVITLTNMIAFTNQIPFTDDLEMQYYRYPAGSNVAQLNFELEPLNGDVNMVEKHGLPLPTIRVFDQHSELPGLQIDQILITNRPPANILPGSYYIGVYNAEPNQTDVDYTIKVTETTLPYNIIRLADGESIEFTVGDNFVSDDAEVENYFLFDVVSTNAATARFEILNADGDAQFLLKQEELPTQIDNDRSSTVIGDRPGSGKILVHTNDVLPSVSGRWFMSVLNQRTEDLNFTIRASLEVDAPWVTTLTNQLWMTNTVAIKQDGFPEEMDYYRFVVDPAAEEVEFVVEPIMGGDDANVDLILKKGSIPTLADLDVSSENGGSEIERITLDASSAIPVSGGEWFMAVVNRETSDEVTYRVRASQAVDFAPIPLENGVWFTNVITGNPPGAPTVPVLYYFDVDQNAVDTTFTLSNLEGGLNGNIDLLVKFDSAPTLSDFDTASVNAGIVDEIVVLTKNSSPALQSGRWYLAVINRGITDVDYRIKAEQQVEIVEDVIEVPSDILFQGNQICVSWESEVGQTYWVEGKVLEADPVWDGLAGPIVATDILSEQCFDFPIEHQIFRVVIRTKQEPPEPPVFYIDPVVALKGNQICLSWDATVGQRYSIQGRTSLTDVDWTEIEQALAAMEVMEYCIDVNTPFRYFRIEPVDGPVPPVPTTIDPVLALVDNQLCLTWVSEVNRNYTVQGKQTLSAGDWDDVASVLAAAESTVYCVAIDTPYQYFRIIAGEQGEPPALGPFVDVALRLAGGQICLDWVSEAGRSYQIEGVVSLDASEWTVIETVTADAGATSYCIDLPSEYRFLRVRAGDNSEPPPVDGDVFIDAVLSLVDDQICLEWSSQAGDVFTIEARSGLLDVAWEEVEQVVAVGETTRFCADLPTVHRFFRVRVGGVVTPPDNQEVVGFLDPTLALDNTGQLCLGWSSTPGSAYLVQGVEVLGSSDWKDIERVTADQVDTRYCLGLPTVYRSFRIAELADSPDPGLEPEPSVSSYIDPVLAVSDNQICLTWQPVEGKSYQVQGLFDIQSDQWEVIDSLAASVDSLTHCIALPSSHQFYRIALVDGVVAGDGQGVGGDVIPATIDSVTLENGQVKVKWTGVSGMAYRVSFADALVGPWLEIPETVSSGTNSFEFSDDGSLTGGLQSPRFYRVEQLPTP